MNAPLGRLRRRVNRRFYRVLFRLYRAAFPTPPWAGRVPVDRRRRILVVRHDRVGDLLVTTPLLSFLEDAAPGAEIDVLASPANAALLRGDSRVARIFVNDHTWPGWLRVLPALRRRRYDLILSPITLKGLREGLTASLIARRDAYKVSSWRPTRYQGLFTAVVRLPASTTHMADQVLAVGRGAFGVPTSLRDGDHVRYPMRIALDARAQASVAGFLAVHAPGAFVAVNASAAVANRDWASWHCAETLALLLARHPDLVFVLTPAPGKDAAVREVAERCASARVLVAPHLPLLELAALAARASIVISPSTALVHLASALGRPVVALYAPEAPTDVALWLPRGVPHRALASPLRGAVSDIATADVAAAFDALRAEVEGRASARVAASAAAYAGAPPSRR